MKTNWLSKSESESPVEAEQRTIEAEQLDTKIRLEWKAAKKSIVKVGALLTQMRESQLWRYLKGSRYRNFYEYVESVIGGDTGRSRVFELLAVHGLTEGENPLPKSTVDRLGIKRAVQLARLDGSQRTDELVDKALKSSVREVRRTVDEKINETLPPSERREITVFFGRYYPASLVDRFEELEERAVGMYGIRDGDTSISLRAKFMAALLANFEANFREELLEADQINAATDEIQRRKVISIERGIEVDEQENENEQDDEPPEPGEF